MKSEIRIGIFVLFFIISLIGFLFIIDKLDFIKRNEPYVIEFDRIEKLEIGNYVKLKGNIKVGKISNITFSESKKKALVNIYFQDQSIEKLFLKYNIIFKEASSGLIGSSHINMIIGKPYPNQMILKEPKRYFFAKSEKNIASSINDVQEIIQNISSMFKKEDIQKIITNITNITNTFNNYLTSHEIQNILTNLNTSSNSIKEILKRVNGLTKEFDKHNIQKMVNHIKNLINNLQKIIINFDSKFNDISLEINKIIENIFKITNSLNDSKYPIGYLINSPEAKKLFQEIINNFNVLVKKLNTHPIVNFNLGNNKKIKNPF